MNRCLAALALSAVALAVLTSSAAARPPAGDWTFLRKDAFRHYACKVADRSQGGAWRVRTATFINGRDDARQHRIGAYAALARGNDRTIVTSRDDARWRNGYIQLTLRGARSD